MLPPMRPSPIMPELHRSSFLSPVRPRARARGARRRGVRHGVSRREPGIRESRSWNRPLAVNARMNRPSSSIGRIRDGNPAGEIDPAGAQDLEGQVARLGAEDGDQQLDGGAGQRVGIGGGARRARSTGAGSRGPPPARGRARPIRPHARSLADTGRSGARRVRSRPAPRSRGRTGAGAGSAGRLAARSWERSRRGRPRRERRDSESRPRRETPRPVRCRGRSPRGRRRVRAHRHSGCGGPGARGWSSHRRSPRGRSPGEPTRAPGRSAAGSPAGARAGW